MSKYSYATNNGYKSIRNLTCSQLFTYINLLVLLQVYTLSSVSNDALL